MPNIERIIMGIDPGTIAMGYGIVKTKGQKVHLVTMGVIKLDRYDNHYIRLKRIYDRVTSLIEEYLPDELAIEAPFYGKNVQSMLKLGRAQGVAMAAALNRDIPITEYVPMRIKQAITGNGHASKEQVAGMLKHLLSADANEILADLDASDAVAAAVCHIFLTANGQQSTKGAVKSWGEFVRQNPDRIKR